MSLRIERLDLVPWGNFTDHSLQFALTPGVVELVDGPNAAGKSTISRAEVALLYGIPARTVDNHTFEYADLRIGARLIVDGDAAEVVRRKANSGSLRTPDGAIIGVDPLPAALGGMTADVYTSFFQVDNETLQRGGRELLEGKGEVGASLFAAAAGIATLHDRLGAFDARAAAIFGRRSRATELARELNRLRDAERTLRQALLKPAKHREMSRELERALALCQKISRRVREVEVELAEIGRAIDIAPLFDRHREVLDARAELGEVPRLDAGAERRRLAAQAKLRVATTQAERARAERERLAGSLAEVDVDDVLLGRAAEIRAVFEFVPVIEKAAADRRKLEAQLQGAENGLGAAARTVGVAPVEIEGLRRADTAHRALDSAVADRERLEERSRLSARRVAAAERRLTEAREEVRKTSAPQADAVGPLESALVAARPGLSLPQRITEAREQTRRLGEEARHAVARLTPRPARADELPGLAIPPAELVDSLIARADGLAGARRDLASDRRRWEADSADVRARREQLRVVGEPPTPARLIETRVDRNARWADIRQALDSGHAPPVGAPDIFEKALGTADDVADALATNAAGVERAAGLPADQSRLNAATEALDRRAAELDVQERELDAEWDAAWSSTGLARIELGVVRAWLAAHADARGALRAAADARASLTALEAELTEAATALSARLAERDVAVGKATLAELVERAEREVAAQRDRSTAADKAEAAVTDAEAALDEARAEGAEAEACFEAWRTAWPQRCANAGLPAEADPEVVPELLRAVKEGLGHAEQIAALRTRMKGMDRDRDSLSNRVAAIRDEVARDLADRAPTDVARALKDRLDEHERRRARRDTLRERVEHADSQIAEADADVADAEVELDEMCRDAACATPNDLPEAEDRVRRARELDAAIAAQETQITETGRGAFSELQAAAAEFDLDEARARSAALSEERDTATVERDDVNQRIGELRRELEDAERDDRAVQAAQDIEFSRARITELAREHALARLSAAVLRRAIERYRDLHQDPLVARANLLFSRFTEGTYVELFVDVDDKSQGFLVARRRDRAIHVMEQMSKGTREQLFLALRIAAIERYVETSGPVPVIFDDVFVESDDVRCVEIFKALGELAAKTQVIVLTHHHHLVTVGRQALGDMLRVQELPSAKLTLRAAA